MSHRKSTVRTPVVEFARGSDETPDGDVVRVKGVIFRAGVYPHQGYTATAEDNRATVANFSPVPLDLGHPSSASPLDGQFGHLESVELSEDGSTIFGTAAIQRWFFDRLGGAKLRVSASFDRATKAIRRLSFVTNPQISDAELQAAFACACGHDEAKAETPTTEDRPMAGENDRKARALALVQEMNDDELAQWLDEDETEEVETDTHEAETSDFSEAAALRAEVEELKAERRRERAAAFAKDMKVQNRIAPFEEAATAAVMFSAMSDDADLGDTVNFAVGEKAAVGTREQMVRAAYGQRIPHRKTQEYIGTSDFSEGRTLGNGGDRPETDAEYAARVVAKHNGRNRIAGAAS